MSQGNTRFRTSFTHTEGNVPAFLMEGKVVNINMVNWTVDVASSFDKKRYFDVQVGSPYMHWDNGEGIYIMPEVGAKCIICLPSDSSPPFVAAFVMPFENVDAASDDAPKGTTSKANANGTSSGASFAGGRPRAKPGDIWLRTRDDNFIILHRGGTVQIGANELAQRIYIPLNNYIMDISDNYVHHNQCGSMYWGLQATPTKDKFPTEFMQTFRVFANDKYAEVRVKAGKVDDPVTGTIDKDASLKQVVYEIVVAPQGFDPETGSTKDAKALVMRFAFDKEGNALLGGTGELAVYYKKKITFRTDDSFNVQAGKEITMKASTGAIIDGGSHAHVKGGTVKLGPGATPVALQGSMVQVSIPYIPVPVPGSPPLVLFGTIVTGQPTVLA